MVLGVGSYAHSKCADVWKECHHACRCPRVENSAPNLVFREAPRSRTIARWRHCAYYICRELWAERAAHVLLSLRAEWILEGHLSRAEVVTNGQVKWNFQETRLIVQDIVSASLDFAAVQPKARVDICECTRVSDTPERRQWLHQNTKAEVTRSHSYQRHYPCYSPSRTCAACKHSPRRLHR